MKLFRTLILVLTLLGIAGCGNCGLDPSQFIPKDMLPSDAPDFGPKTPDLDASTDLPDTRKLPNDVNISFDFGNPDQAILPFALRAIVPNSGPLRGENQVRILGDALPAETVIFIGSQKMEVQLIGGALIGRIPKGSGAGPVSVKAITRDGTIRTLVDAYTYVEDLRIDTVSPKLVSTDGGHEIEIRGTGFSDPIAVSFSSDDALGVNFINSSLLRVIVPPRPRGFASLRVTTRSESVEKTKALEYFDEIRIEKIIPASGLITGGDIIEIFGKGFTTQSTVSFDGIPAEILSVDINQAKIRLKTPAHTLGLADVFVRTSKSSAVLKNGFYYRENNDPILADISPNLGPVSGGNIVRLIGHGLDAPMARFFFGATEGSPILAESSFVDITVPAGVLGSVDVIFQAGPQEINRLKGAYSYENDLIITSLTPASGPSVGGTQLQVIGEGFTGLTEFKLGGRTLPFTVISDTEIHATTLPYLDGKVNLHIKRNGLHAKKQDAFIFMSTPEIWGFSPTRGARSGGTYVHIRGRGFFGNLGVQLDGISGSQIQRLDRNNIIFYTPPHVPGDAILKVTTDTNIAEGPYAYSYFEPASRFGGASGDAVDGAVNITVFALSEGPLKEAFVMLSTRADTRYQGYTDANGQLTLSGPGVIGAQTTTATAAGYSTATLQSVDAENITILLNKLDPNPGSGGGDPPPEARIFGSISADAKLADPADEHTFNMAVVATTKSSIGGSSFPPPGNNSIVLGQSGRFDIRSRTGDLALLGLCGTYHEPSGVFTPQFMDVERFIFLGNKEELKIDLKCTIPLDQVHQYKLINGQFAPTGPDMNRVQVFWDFGFEGVFPSRVTGQTLSNIVGVSHQPEVKGELADLKFIARGGSFSAFGSPFTISTLLNITNPLATIEMPTLLDVPHALHPLPGGIVENNRISFAGSVSFQPDFYIGIIRNDVGIPVYQFLLPGTEHTFVLPEFPDFSSLAVDKRPVPFQQGALNLTVIAARLRAGHIYEAFSYRDIDSGQWEAYAQNSWAIKLPQN